MKYIYNNDQDFFKKSLLVLSLLFLTGFMSIIKAQTMRFAARQFVDANGDTLNYRISTSDYNLSRKYPVVIFLHGSGERGKDNISQLKWGVQNFVTDKMMMSHPAIVIAPQCPRNEQWSNYTPDTLHNEIRLNPKPSLPMKLTMELLDTLIADMPVDTSRIYITGLSMGGYGTYDAIERWPNRFAAAVPVAGAGDPTLVHRIVHLPIWDFHGADDPIVNPVYSRKMINALLKAGAHPGFTEYPGVGHFSWVPAYSNTQVLDWMFRQHRSQ
jgi:predicted peptidase